jgi:hypothetical protein
MIFWIYAIKRKLDSEFITTLALVKDLIEVKLAIGF